MINKHLVLLGIRGLPAQHGGFETFAEYLCLFLVNRGWKVTVYCQEQGVGATYETEWNGIKRIHIYVNDSGPLGTVFFDWQSVVHSLSNSGVFLTLGYNTAMFNIILRAKNKKNIINMDGIEWKRRKWGTAAKVWFWLNERFGCWFGNHLVADHPRIEDHLATRVSRQKITMIPYGAREITQASPAVIEDLRLEANRYAVLIARAEPENSILEAVKAFACKQRNAKLVVLGNYDPNNNSYHRAVMDAASDEVIFPGAIYDADKVSALRLYARAYVHGHQVGGTNPSLVEALGAGNAVLAHDNPFNRWVAKDGAAYFDCIDTASALFDRLFVDDEWVDSLRQKSRTNFQQNFQWSNILDQYESLLFKWLPKD
ncbi:DUF1972 domain-containing protein [Motiliproteus sp. SC1-56]|uniref:DUF1972 domain-containing protein n=1 Tax=Motiliproteus sp. SC1-56 TaxID=2799565 RepID=UPI001A90C2A8|nr:DUF1972 domain-containing protein [Motiliproteus sp. SC1-56]